MNLTINFDKQIAITDVGVKDNLDTDRLYNILYDGAFSKNVKHISIINSFFIGKKILKAVKVCLVREIEVSINGTAIDSWEALMPYQSEITEYAMKKEAEAMSAEVYNIIINNKELIHPFSRGIDTLHSFLDTYIYASQYDVSMSSTTSYDTKSCGTYEDRQGHKHEYSRNYIKRKPSSTVSLYDKLQMYFCCKWFTANSFQVESKDGISTSDIDSYTGEDISHIPIAVDRYKTMEDVVVPISACDTNTEYKVMMYLYGEYADE